MQRNAWDAIVLGGTKRFPGGVHYPGAIFLVAIIWGYISVVNFILRGNSLSASCPRANFWGTISGLAIFGVQLSGGQLSWGQLSGGTITLGAIVRGAIIQEAIVLGQLSRRQLSCSHLNFDTYLTIDSSLSIEELLFYIL